MAQTDDGRKRMKINNNERISVYLLRIIASFLVLQLYIIYHLRLANIRKDRVGQIKIIMRIFIILLTLCIHFKHIVSIHITRFWHDLLDFKKFIGKTLIGIEVH